MTEDDRWPEDWHNSRPVAIAGGIAAVVLIGILIYAVMSVSDGSVDRPTAPLYATTSSATTSATLRTPTSSTSYPRNSVQTSEAGPPPAEAPPADETPSPDETTDEDEPSSTDPYATTTPERAGSI